MTYARILIPTVGVTSMLCMGTTGIINPADVFALQSSEKENSQMNELGVPPLGTVMDFEHTQKEASHSEMHSPESNRQVTLGGAQYVVEGKIVNIDGQTFDIKKTESGERVRLIVNQDTNLNCATAPPASGAKQSETIANDRMTSEQPALPANGLQRAQGYRTEERARGAGFRIGQCDFLPGDGVKAEVDDMGRITTLNYVASAPATEPHVIGESAGTGELAIPGRQEKPGQLDMTGAGGSIPKEYAVLPIPVGELTTTTSAEFLKRPVNDQKGTMIGTLESFIMDTHSGRIEYAVMALKDGANLQPVPWSAIHIKRDGRGTLVPTIDTSKYQIMPSLTKKDAADLSPSIKELVAQMEVVREQEPRKSKMREPVMKEPAVGGPFGEDQTGRGGLSGARALPPESDAPRFEREKDKRY